MIQRPVPAWVPEHDYLPEEDRSVISALRTAPGIVGTDDFVCSPTPAPSWNVRIAPGRAVIDGNVSPWTQGSYVIYSPDEKEVAITPPDPTLNRIDVIVLHVHDQDNSTEQGYDWSPDVVQGTPGTGRPNPLPPNSQPLQVVNVRAGDTAIRQENLGPPSRSAPWEWPDGWPSGDVRRASGPILYQRIFRRQDQIAGGGWHTKTSSLDLSLPDQFEEMNGWPFPIVAELTFWFWIHMQIPGPWFLINIYVQRKPAGTNTWINANYWPLSLVSQGFGLPSVYTWHSLVPYEAREAPRWYIDWSPGNQWGELEVMALFRVYPRWAQAYFSEWEIPGRPYG